jgi:MbtH protein
MRQNDEQDTRSYVAAVNHEDQYALWPADRPLPHGWQVASGPDDKTACLEWIRQHWTDLTPLSLRRSVPA